ncbi:MAG: hypothetical protein PVG74_10210, partial [Desulfobacterales bacterium]
MIRKSRVIITTDHGQPTTNDDVSAKKRQNLNKWSIYAAIGFILILTPHVMPNNYWLRIFTMTGLWVM